MEANSTLLNHGGTVYVVAGSTGASGGVQAGYPHNAFPYSVNDGGFYFEVDNNRPMPNSSPGWQHLRPVYDRERCEQDQ